MTENEKLRALLAEARALLLEARPTNARCDCTQCKPIDVINARIVAALAEPVAGCGECAETKAALRWSDDIMPAIIKKYRRERDKARSEAEVLRNALAGANNSLAAHISHEVQLRVECSEAQEEAFKRGAEAMREAAASCVGSDTALLQTYRSVLEGRIRALPLPEDKP